MGRVRGKDASRLFRSAAGETRWCENCGVPVIAGDRCPACSEPARLIHAAYPRDLRPALGLDDKITREAVEMCYGRRVASRILPGPNGLILLNKVQHFEAGDEVIAFGVEVGVRYYDPLAGSWMFRLDRYGAAIVLAEGLPGYARLRVRLRRGDVVPRGSVEELVEPDGGAEWLAVEDRRGMQGVARLLGDGRLRIHKVWRRLRVPLRRRSRSYAEAVAVNKPLLEMLEEEAVGFLEHELRRHSGFSFVTVSGGKDSTAAASLAAEAGVREAFYTDTGVEHSETPGHAELVADKLGLDLTVCSAGNALWDNLARYGPPARDYRWCTRLLKLVPLARALRGRGASRVVVVTGQRAAESAQRASAGRVSRTGPPNPEGVMLAPIQWWTSLAVHMYLDYKGLPRHPLYMEGYERIGCYMCPASRLPELNHFAEKHPEEWSKWQGFIQGYARGHGLPEAWARLALWRWRYSYPSDLEHALRRLGLRPRELLAKALNVRAAACSLGDMVEVVPLDIQGPIALEDLKPLAKAAGFRATLYRGSLVLERSNARVTIDQRPALLLQEGDVRDLRDALRATYMAAECIQCSLCIYACTNGAIRVEEGRPRVDEEKCTSCGKCVAICPSAMKADEAVNYLKLHGALSF